MTRTQFAGAAAAALIFVCGALVISQRPAGPVERLRSELDLRDGVLYAHDATRPFTGALVEKYETGAKKLEIAIREGKADGLSRGWLSGGQLEVEEHFVNGVSDGLRTRWHANGQKRSEEQIVAGKVVGRYVEWHQNGQKAVEMTVKDGAPEGLVRAWNPDGTPRSEATFEVGKMVKREFFSSTVASASTPEVGNP